MDRANRRLFLGCRSKVMAVVDADSGKVITTLPIGDHVDATAFDPETKLIFNSNGEGTITVIHQDSPDKYSIVETVKTVPRAKTMALDPKTHRLFLSTVGKRAVRSAGRGTNRIRELDPNRSLPYDLGTHILCENLQSHCSRMALLRFLASLIGCTSKSSRADVGCRFASRVKLPFRFVAYGDSRFHDPKEPRPQILRYASPWYRQSRRSIRHSLASPAISSTTASTQTTGRSGTAKPASGVRRKSRSIQALGNHESARRA